MIVYGQTDSSFWRRYNCAERPMLLLRPSHSFRGGKLWPIFSLHGIAKGRGRSVHERQVTAQTRTWHFDSKYKLTKELETIQSENHTSWIEYLEDSASSTNR